MRKFRNTKNVIRLSLRGCTNRPFYHIVVMRNREPRDGRVRETLGTFDPMPNIHNEKLIALKFNDLTRWLAHGAVCSKPVEILLGYAGFFPIHPNSRLAAFRKAREKDIKKSDDTESENVDADLNTESDDSVDNDLHVAEKT